jgi:hypothetical protein
MEPNPSQVVLPSFQTNPFNLQRFCHFAVELDALEESIDRN